ncbi:MAG: DUF6159 family protein [Bacteroidia bacterium]
MSFFDRLSNGWELTMSSFTVIKKNKQLLVFPIITGLALVLVIGSFFTAIIGLNNWDFKILDGEISETNFYMILFGYYVVNYFIIVFFNMALVHCARLYFQGEEPSVAEGIKFSMTRIGAIFSWAIFAATIGTILKAIQENVGFVGKIITGIIGIAWGISTFFVMPIIAYENVGPMEAVKRSALLMKNKWGESLGATFSFGVVQFVAILILAIPVVIIGLFIHPIIAVIIGLLGFFIILTVSSAASTIFIAAVYETVNDRPVKEFESEALDSLFIGK